MTTGARVEALHVRYPGRPSPALTGISLTVAPGETVGVSGPTGAGKSTLALALAGFIPRVIRASVQGEVLVDGVDVTAASPGDALGRCGIVFSSPADQLSGAKLTVREELAFGLENLGVPRSAMDGRIDEVMARLAIGHLAEREPASLSGGEQQRVAIASIVTMGPGLLLLDEPTAELDPDGSAAVATMFRALATTGTAILSASHDRRILDACDRQILLESGRIVDVASDTPDPGPLHWPASGSSGRRGAAVAIDGVSYRYPSGVLALDEVSLRVGAGEAVAIVGANGSGKTTLAKHLIGLLRPMTGQVRLDGIATDRGTIRELAQTVGFAFQDPRDQVFERTVAREVSFGPRCLGRTTEATSAIVSAALEVTGLTTERDTNPYDLDRSIRKLVTLAGVLAIDPAVLVLDEPTTGLDPAGVLRVGRIVDAMRAAGRTVIAITQDPAFAARWFERTVVMDAGRVVDRPPPAA